MIYMLMLTLHGHSIEMCDVQQEKESRDEKSGEMHSREIETK